MTRKGEKNHAFRLIISCINLVVAITHLKTSIEENKEPGKSRRLRRFAYRSSELVDSKRKSQRLSLGLASMFNLPKLIPFLPFSFAPPSLGILLPAAGLFDGLGASTVFSREVFMRCFFAFG